jgi:hypothetical protein
MDNLPAHKVAGVRETIEATGAQLRLLPPYSPDLNPIEQSFAKLKACLPKAGERSIPALWDRIGAILQTFTPEECKQLLQTCRLRVKLKGIRSKMLDGVMHGLVVRWANNFVASVNLVRQSGRQSLG